MSTEKFVRDDLLYHSAHGLCRIDGLTKETQAGKEIFRYSLVPKKINKSKMRFVIADADLAASGFHRLISVKEANAIMAYLKNGDHAQIPSESEFGRENHPWKLAESLLSSSAAGVQVKDQKKRQTLERSVRGLVEELALVFKINLKEMVDRILKSLGSVSKINPLVLAAFKHASGE
ncbi:MAG: hypothetical protein COV74_04860 [Candidatus Omnitrophica bacterium CG11_big_fil_rev_8_21_14_0_20_45_26]|uniref:CarD-like/TRCF RNAP-interacting domain-containing protein n=1 Tax=Candidatus Abzuiibacterium crystallinum TaxID=1974748 RepID=A0A2H0LPQ2_9BACT|nr:MAG: hypothetical protein COV74_04860 [Candidatus Omnitrophica bacterium CG11_big_fil_rev_8_21_14_0_20_45_26]PIW63591.1 MAG: hypothetical protein COW12_09775 [Candidatus Omnitrophica bacterium CG12_big_fil_rev_8_21_14_0_65_45_16]